MKENNVKKIVYSYYDNVYGNNKKINMKEDKKKGYG
jgi:UDP-glucose 4-epimerase